jgi:hypothetical protein|tara:strand:- start:136 stop:333 length:198 start_codon:yes stop_codon:yes gene_type:complete
MVEIRNADQPLSNNLIAVIQPKDQRPVRSSPLAFGGADLDCEAGQTINRHDEILFEGLTCIEWAD